MLRQQPKTSHITKKRKDNISCSVFWLFVLQSRCSLCVCVSVFSVCFFCVFSLQFLCSFRPFNTCEKVSCGKLDTSCKPQAAIRQSHHTTKHTQCQHETHCQNEPKEKKQNINESNSHATDQKKNLIRRND